MSYHLIRHVADAMANHRIALVSEKLAPDLPGPVLVEVLTAESFELAGVAVAAFKSWQGVAADDDLPQLMIQRGGLGTGDDVRYVETTWRKA